LPPTDSSVLSEQRLSRFMESLNYLGTLFAVCDDEEVSKGTSQDVERADGKRSARPTILGSVTDDLEAGVPEVETLRCDLRFDSWDTDMSVQWLAEHSEGVRKAMSPHITQLRSVLDIVLTQINAGGLTLEESLSQCYGDPCQALRCFVANIQVWGSLGSVPSTPPCSAVDKNIELFLMCDQNERLDVVRQVSEVARTLTPDKLATYHQGLARALVAQARHKFCQRVRSLRQVLELAGQAEGAAAARLHATTMKHLHEVESLILDIERLLHCADVQCGGADTKTASTTSKTDILMSLEDVTEALEGGRPTFAGFERSRTGYVLCVDCGHNGSFSDGEEALLEVHLRAAQFGEAPPVSSSIEEVCEHPGHAPAWVKKVGLSTDEQADFLMSSSETQFLAVKEIGHQRLSGIQNFGRNEDIVPFTVSDG